MKLFSTLVVTTLFACGAFAWQEDPPTDDPPATPPEEEVAQEPTEEPAEEASESPPSLAELLGIETERDSNETDAAAESERQRSLDSALAEEEPSAAFKQAILDMDETAVLLRNKQATGLGTQRLQIRIVERLQALIDSAKRQQQQQQQQQSSNSDSGQDPGQRQEGEEQQQQGQQQQQQQGGEANGVNPPSPQHAELEESIDETRIEWGGLPPRVRELINQGMRDRVSELYRSLTEQYYRRMAEDASK